MRVMLLVTQKKTFPVPKKTDTTRPPPPAVPTTAVCIGRRLSWSVAQALAGVLGRGAVIGRGMSPAKVQGVPGFYIQTTSARHI